MPDSIYTAQLSTDGEGNKSQFSFPCVINTSNDPQLGSDTQQLRGARFAFLLSTSTSQHDFHTHSVSHYGRKLSDVKKRTLTHVKSHTLNMRSHAGFSCCLLTSYVAITASYAVRKSVCFTCVIIFHLTIQMAAYMKCF